MMTWALRPHGVHTRGKKANLFTFTQTNKRQATNQKELFFAFARVSGVNEWSE